MTAPKSDDEFTVYLRRDAEGDIASISRTPTADHPEPSPSDRADVLTFLRRLSPRNQALAESDLSLIRVIEDLIDVLIHKDVLRFTDLPDRVQSKLLERRKLRGSLRSLDLLGDDQDDTI